MKKFKSMLLILLILFLFASCDSEGMGETVASVGEETVTAGEIVFMMSQNIEAVKTQMSSINDEQKREYWNTDVDGKKPVDIIKENALGYLINYAALVNAAKEEKITVPDDEVKARLASYTSEDLKNLKNIYGVTKDSVKRVLRKQIFQQKYVSRILESKADYTPSEEQLTEDLMNNYYKAQHILISVSDAATGEAYSEEKKEEAMKKAERLLKKVKRGGDFETIMLENSDDPGIQSYPDGYVFTNGEMITEFEETVKTLSLNEISDIVETSYGYHIIKRLPVTVDDFAAKETELVNNYKSRYLEAFIEELKSKYEVKQNDAKLNKITVNTEF